MSRPFPKAILMMGLVAVLAPLSGPAAAQQTPTSETAQHGLRPLSWPGRPAQPASAATPYARPEAQAVRQNRPAIIARGGYALNPSAAAPQSYSPQQGLTPASAFFVSPAPRPLPVPAPAPAPLRTAAAPAPAPLPMPAPAPAPPAVPQPVPHSTPAPLEDSAPQDPMAPRRDAPIFRIAPTAQPTPLQVQQQPPATSHARYYSVHRQYGRQPDPAPQTAPIYLDALPVDVTGMAGNSDLAEPPAPPTLIRNSNGRIQALPDLNDVGP